MLLTHEWAHDSLTSLESSLEREIAAQRSASRPVDLDTPIGRLSRMDALQGQKLAQANLRRLELRLRHVRAARAALAAGTWGECRRCGDDIEEARLRARPEAPLCLGCQEALEP